jgi:hypothetical protein
VGVAFAEGHSLDDAVSKARVPIDALGRMLTLNEAKQVLKRLATFRRKNREPVPLD